MVRQLLFDELSCVVARAVIHHNHFQRARVVLKRDALNRTNNIVLLVIGSHQNADAGITN